MPVDVDRPAAEVGLQIGDELGEARHRHRPPPEVEQRGVAAPDAEHEAPAGGLLHGRRDRRERSGMTRVRIRDTGREAERVGRLRGERNRDERVAAEVL